MEILKLEDVSYKYQDAKKYALKNINFVFEKGKINAIVGHSGSGKTTLLSLMASLDEVTGGAILYKGKNINKIDKDEYRSKNVGVIFQSFNLLPSLTAKENIRLSMDIAGFKPNNVHTYIDELLEKVHISKDKQDKRILRLSGGEQQRIAIARALSYEPDIILADEPTGNLDRANEKEVLKVLRNLANEGKCIIIVTHSEEVAKQADVIFDLEEYKRKNI